MAPVLTVQIYYIGFPCLMGHGFPEQIHQPALESVLQPGPHAVIPAVPQHEAFIFLIIPVRKQFCFERFFTVFAFRFEFETLLGHVQRIVAVQGDIRTLVDDPFSGVVVHLHIAFIFDPGVLHFPVNGVFEGQPLFFVDALSDSQHSLFGIPQVVRIHRDGYHRQAVIRLDKEGTCERIAGPDILLRESSGPDHGRSGDFQRFPVVRRGFPRRFRSVQGIKHLCAFREDNPQILGRIIKTGLRRERRRRGISREAADVRRKRRRRVITVQAAVL